MIRKLSTIGLLAFAVMGCQTQGKVAGNPIKPPMPQLRASQKNDNGLKSYNEVITSQAITDEGLFNTHKVGEKLYFEIPLELMEKDMLLVSRIAQVPSGFGGGYVNAGSKVNEQVVRWSRRGNNVDLKVISFENESDENSPIYQSVLVNNFFPILYSAKIAAYNSDSTAVVAEVNSLFENDIEAINGISSSLKKRYKVKKLDANRSYIESVNAPFLKISR
jgi:hypothetical protein